MKVYLFFSLLVAAAFRLEWLNSASGFVLLVTPAFRREFIGDPLSKKCLHAFCTPSPFSPLPHSSSRESLAFSHFCDENVLLPSESPTIRTGPLKI